ncbi:MAG: RNA pseudouridine synthase [Sandaracinaceae bacterium]|nr:RNA pseudouridine synthase [Sandaracinaceae bacterium]
MDRIRVLYDAGGVLVLDKPPGLETTGRTRDDPGGLEHHVTARLGRPVWPVHQLDRDTSGVVIFVRRKAAVAEWQERLRRATKRYVAIVHGRMVSETVDAALAYDPELRRWVTRADGKAARTVFEVLDGRDRASLVEARPATGRTHQIRVHLASVGHPLFGEGRYREPACVEHPRHALHVRRIEVDDLAFEAPLPEDLRELATRLGFDPR